MCNALGGLENESEKWTYFWVRKMVQEIPWRGQEVLFLDMYGYQWIYPEGIHGSPWIEIAMGYPWVGARARALARRRAQVFLFKLKESKIPWRGQQVMYLDMYGYQWIYPESIHPWISMDRDSHGVSMEKARARAGALARAGLSF